MAHIKLNTIQAGEPLTHEAYNRSLESWLPTKQGKVSLENIRDQGLDLCNFDHDSLTKHNSTINRQIEIDPGTKLGEELGFRLFVFPFVRTQGFDYVLRVSGDFDFEANYNVTSHPNAETAMKIFELSVKTKIKDTLGNTIQGMRTYSPSIRRIGIKGKQGNKVFCRENYTITSYINPTLLNYPSSQPDEGKIEFHMRWRLIFHDDPLKTPKLIRFKNFTGSVTTYRR